MPPAEFTSYYGRPILKAPTWEARDVAGYLFLGGLAGASSLLAAGGRAHRAARPGPVDQSHCAGGDLAVRRSRWSTTSAARARFVNMLRVFKPTSPMSIGSWLLAAYGPAAGLAALTDVTGRARSARPSGDVRCAPCSGRPSRRTRAC